MIPTDYTVFKKVLNINMDSGLNIYLNDMTLLPQEYKPKLANNVCNKSI